MQHGLLDSSDSWVSNYESKSIPFILANKGYDVWLGNSRGNKYSRNHVNLDPNKDSEFWNFSYHEMGKYDLPVMIKFILSKTGRDKISYIGHSQGTAQLFSAMTYNNEFFSSTLNSFIALGPITSVENVGSSFLKIIADTRIDFLLERLSINELLNNPEAVNQLQVTMCRFLGIVCSGLLNLLADANPHYDNMDRLLVFVSHYPGGASLRSIQHFADSIRRKTFSPYLSETPYEMRNIRSIPIGLFVGKQDLLATLDDNRNLKSVLESNDVLKFYNEYDDMGHATFFISESNNYVKDLLLFIEKYGGI